LLASDGDFAITSRNEIAAHAKSACAQESDQENDQEKRGI
jgi:hypothetical protein